MRLKLCGWAGCDALCLSSSYYCRKHKAIADKRKTEQTKLFHETKRTSSRPYHHLYNSVRWRKMRKEFLSEHPLCIKCGCSATIVDHIIPHKGETALFYNIKNLQPMCWSCHSAKTLEENNYFNR